MGESKSSAVAGFLVVSAPPTQAAKQAIGDLHEEEKKAEVEPGRQPQQNNSPSPTWLSEPLPCLPPAAVVSPSPVPYFSPVRQLNSKGLVCKCWLDL